MTLPDTLTYPQPVCYIDITKEIYSKIYFAKSAKLISAPTQKYKFEVRVFFSHCSFNIAITMSKIVIFIIEVSILILHKLPDLGCCVLEVVALLGDHFSKILGMEEFLLMAGEHNLDVDNLNIETNSMYF